MDDILTSYCGLYCLDCIPSRGELFSLVQKVDILLEDLQFEEYARMKSAACPGLSQYPVFSDVLKDIESLQCHDTCRNEGGKEVCDIRSCAQSKGLTGCWECELGKNCNLLQPLIKVHPNLQYHHELIRKHGIDDWSQYRKAHYKWQEEQEI